MRLPPISTHRHNKRFNILLKRWKVLIANSIATAVGTPPSEASAHLQKKYKYMADHNYISTTENFIDSAASKSSMSVKAYEVKCGDGKPVESKQWFINTLKSYRTEKHD
jgi:hypothetical protein